MTKVTQAVQSAWDEIETLPPIEFTPDEAAHLYSRISSASEARRKALEEAAQLAEAARPTRLTWMAVGAANRRVAAAIRSLLEREERDG